MVDSRQAEISINEVLEVENSARLGELVGYKQ
jgi:hypothetical protein